MSITSCIKDVAKSIAPNCDNPIISGYTGRAVLIPVNNANTTIVQNGQNKRIIEAITATDETTIPNVVAIENYYVNPFENSNKASNADNGVKMFTKTVSFHIPLRGAEVSKDIVEPLVKNPIGFIAILEKKDKVGDGSFEVVGLQSGLTVNADGIAQDEATSNGDTIVTMTCVESWFECTFFRNDYASTLQAFNALYEQGV